MFLHPGGESENVGIENDISRLKPNFIHQNSISPLTNAHLVFEGGGLTIFIKGHDHNRSSISHG